MGLAAFQSVLFAVLLTASRTWLSGFRSGGGGGRILAVGSIELGRAEDVESGVF